MTRYPTQALRNMIRAQIAVTGYPPMAAADAVAEAIEADERTRERLTKLAEEWR